MNLLQGRLNNLKVGQLKFIGDFAEGVHFLPYRTEKLIRRGGRWYYTIPIVTGTGEYPSFLRTGSAAISIEKAFQFIHERLFVLRWIITFSVRVKSEFKLYSQKYLVIAWTSWCDRVNSSISCFKFVGDVLFYVSWNDKRHISIYSYIFHCINNTRFYGKVMTCTPDSFASTPKNYTGIPSNLKAVQGSIVLFFL